MNQEALDYVLLNLDRLTPDQFERLKEAVQSNGYQRDLALRDSLSFIHPGLPAGTHTVRAPARPAPVIPSTWDMAQEAAR